jgi:hypothetical protein
VSSFVTESVVSAHAGAADNPKMNKVTANVATVRTVRDLMRMLTHPPQRFFRRDETFVTIWSFYTVCQRFRYRK